MALHGSGSRRSGVLAHVQIGASVLVSDRTEAIALTDILYLSYICLGTMKISYSKIRLAKLRNPRFQTPPLSDKDYYDLKVVAKLLNKPVSQVIQTAINTYLYRNEEHHTQRLEFKAAQEEKSVEEIYQELANGEVEEL